MATDRPTEVVGFSLPSVRSGLARPLFAGGPVSVYFDRQPPCRWGEHTHEQFQIVISIDDVDAVLSWRQENSQIKQGVTGQFVWILPPNFHHAADWQGTAGMVVLYVDPNFVRQVCNHEFRTGMVEDYSALARFDLLVGRLTGVFKCLCRRSTSIAPAVVESAATLLATHVLLYFVPRKNPYRLPSIRLRKVFDFVDAHIGESISRGDLARVAGMSVRTFGDSFKERTGLTPNSYIMQRRTVRAMELVDEGKLTKTAIAADLGFSDQSHMMRRIDALRALEIKTPLFTSADAASESRADRD